MSIEPPEDLSGYGPAMLALNPKQRAFVRVFIEYPMLSRVAAARLAGYSDHKDAAKVRAHHLLHSPRVLAAIHEEFDKRFRIDAIMGWRVLVEIAQNKAHPKQLQAALALLERGGFHVQHEQRVRVEHVDMTSEAMVERIEQLARQLNMDPAALLGASDTKMKLVN